MAAQCLTGIIDLLLRVTLRHHLQTDGSGGVFQQESGLNVSHSLQGHIIDAEDLVSCLIVAHKQKLFAFCICQDIFIDFLNNNSMETHLNINPRCYITDLLFLSLDFIRPSFCFCVLGHLTRIVLRKTYASLPEKLTEQLKKKKRLREKSWIRPFNWPGL